jgi:hypothetical protein
VSANIKEDDVRGIVRLAVSDDSLAPCTDDTFDALRQLHPRRAAPANSLLSPPVPDAVSVDDSTLNVLSTSAEDIIEAVESFPAVSAGGLDGVRSQHLKDMTSPYTGFAGQRLMAYSSRRLVLRSCTLCSCQERRRHLTKCDRLNTETACSKSCM